MHQQPHESELKRLHDCKKRVHPMMAAFGPELLDFFKTGIQKRHTKLSAIAECWSQVIPESFQDHCSLESFSAGTLKVIVDSSSHLYELNQLLKAGIQQQLMLACKSSGLRKITLKLGRWYDGEGVERKLRF